jgi:hypothetical protein
MQFPIPNSTEELLLPAAPGKLRTFELNLRQDTRWEQFIASHPDALIYHHPTWLHALEKEYGQQCVSLACEDEQGCLRAILPLFYTRGLPLSLGRNVTGRRLSSLPRTPVAGPLAVDPESAATVIRAAMDLVRSRPGIQLEIKTPIQGLDQLVEGLVSVPWRSTYIQELPSTSEGLPWEEYCEAVRLPKQCGPCKECRRLRFGNAKKQHKVKWAVNKAIKLGLQVREADTEADLADWYRLYLKTMRHNSVPPRPYRLFQELWFNMRGEGGLCLLLAEQQLGGRKRTVAGSIFLRFGQTLFYAFTGCDPADFPLHPHDIIQLESMRSACKQGLRWYDFGEVAEDHEGLAQFKGKWGALPKQLCRYYFPHESKPTPVEAGGTAGLTRKLWRLLPCRVTELLGDWIYRYM